MVEQRAVASANRLGARFLDLYQVHQPNPVVHDHTIMRGMRALPAGMIIELISDTTGQVADARNRS